MPLSFALEERVEGGVVPPCSPPPVRECRRAPRGYQASLSPSVCMLCLIGLLHSGAKRARSPLRALYAHLSLAMTVVLIGSSH